MDNISEHIGQKFQECRQNNNLTQGEVAELAGMEPRYISQIERGISKGSIDTLLKLCNAYRITPDVILYDLLDEEVKKSIEFYDEKFKKLSKRDKETVDVIIDHLLNN
ncbi:MAG: helix-turn-helix transcriptional regulator [Clostridia bacterium]|nr:helix-turn-helix transcriptional regulator [Clostridia bacterium]